MYDDRKHRKDAISNDIGANQKEDAGWEGKAHPSI